MATEHEPTMPPPLDVLIVGAGIGGLAAATALRRAGHNVSLFEQSAAANELGAALHLAPNATRVLRGFGCDETRLRGVHCGRLEVIAADGSTLTSVLADDAVREYGSPWYMCHRVDLHNELKRLAFADDGDGRPAKLHLSSKVVSVDAEKGRITLASGDVHHGDLVVGADGIYSTVRDHIVGPGHSPPPSGSSAYRFMIPVSSLASDPALAAQMPSLTKPGVTLVVGRDQRLVLYPCRDSTLINAVAIHPDTLSQRPTRERNTNSRTAADVKRAYADFAPVFHRLFELAEDIKLWQLEDNDGMDTWIRGRGCLLGDACHPMLPHLAQGASQAIEDSAALGVVFPQGTPAADVASRLPLYEHVRKRRAEAIQQLSRQVNRSRIVQDFTFRHDVVAYARETLTTVWIPSTVSPAPQETNVRPQPGVETAAQRQCDA